MKLGHEITNPETIRNVQRFRVGFPIQIKPGYMNAGKSGKIVSVFPWGMDIVASVDWMDGTREPVSINTIEPSKKGKAI